MRALLENWRCSVSFAWHCLDKGALVFYSLLPLPFVLLGVVAYFLHEDFELVQAGHQHAIAEAAAAREAELNCLAENVYHEARGEPLEGQYAVAEVTMNRVRARAFPDSVCEVVHEQRWDARRKRNVGAFAWTELDSLDRPSGPAWRQARDVATAVYDGEHAPHMPNALYYHAKYIKPSWAKPNRRVATIGSHVFYR